MKKKKKKANIEAYIGTVAHMNGWMDVEQLALQGREEGQRRRSEEKGERAMKRE